MAMDFVEKNIVLRVTKPYPGAHNHIYIGKVVSYDERFLAIDGCVYNFGKPHAEDPTGGLTISPRAVRWLPIQRVQYMRELPPEMDPDRPESFLVSEEGRMHHQAADRPDLIIE